LKSPSSVPSITPASAPSTRSSAPLTTSWALNLRGKKKSDPQPSGELGADRAAKDPRPAEKIQKPPAAEEPPATPPKEKTSPKKTSTNVEPPSQSDPVPEPESDEDTTDYSRERYDAPQGLSPKRDHPVADAGPSGDPAPIPQSADSGHIDLEAAVAQASTAPGGPTPLEDLLKKTPPELRKILEDEFGAEFRGPLTLDPEKLKELAAKHESN